MNKVMKSILREIRKTLGRYMGLLIIIAIGVAFYTGLKSVGPDMEGAADKYFSEYNFFDYRILSNIGFNEEDVAAVNEIDGILELESGYSIDVLGNINQEQRVMKFISVPEKINTLQLISGRMPQASGECVILSRNNGTDIKIGDSINPTSGNDNDLSESINVQTYTVVGIVSSPAFITRDMGNTKIGNGKVQEVAYLPKEDFTLPAYTELSLTLENTDAYQAYSMEYSSYTARFQDLLENLGGTRSDIRYQELIDEANELLNEKLTEYDNSVTKLEDSKTDYEVQIADAEKKLEDAELKLADSQNELQESEDSYNDGIKELEEKRTELNNDFTESEKKLDSAAKQLEATQNQIENQEALLNEQKQQYETAKASGTVPEQQLTAMEAELKEGEQKLTIAKQQYSVSVEEYNKSKAELETGKTNMNEKLHKAQAQLDDVRVKLDEAEVKVLEGEEELLQSKKELTDKKEEAEIEFAKAEQELSDAKIKLDDARQEIDSLEEVEWFILDRESNMGYTDFKDGTERIGGLAEILPLMVFLVAALVSLTSMTRMVDEQRTQIGTMKALGYKKPQIAFKYIFYAASASLIGSASGLIIGFRLLPGVIFGAYKSLYSLPLDTFNISLLYASSSAAAGILVTVLAAYIACNASLMSVPSALMRPLAPKVGKKIFLERVSFFWKHLKFSQKVTIRNIFRYKKRFAMTVFGVACSCALVLSGFGLRSSIRIPADRQFKDIFTYSSVLRYTDSATEIDKVNITKEVKNDSFITGSGQFLFENVEIQNGDSKEDIVIIVPQEPGELEAFIHLLTPADREEILLSDGGAVMTQKIAELMNIKESGTVKVVDEDDKITNVMIGAVCENYLQNYMFMTPEYYESIFGEPAEMNQILLNQNEISEEKQSAFGEKMMSVEGVASVAFMSDIQKNFNDSIGSLDVVVWVIIGSAVLLAFVVLYTLTTININERMREIATIKVLGFYNREVNLYIFREGYILTIFGILLGMFGGILLHKEILDEAIVNQIMYYRQMTFISFLLSGLLTFIISYLVNKLLQNKMKNINMVEALKSIE
jgi:putative ABC transport system permease protein